MRYLKGFYDFGLIYHADKNNLFLGKGFTDSNCATNLDKTEAEYVSSCFMAQGNSEKV